MDGSAASPKAALLGSKKRLHLFNV